MKYIFVGTKTEMNKSARRGAQLVPIGILRSPPFLVGFVLWDLLCLGSVLLIMV
jgi:hypothetical protein